MRSLTRPEPRPQAFLPTATQTCLRIDKYVKAIDRLDHILRGYVTADGVRFSGADWSQSDIDKAKQLLAERGAMLSQWEVMGRPATREQIGIATSYLVTSFFNVPKSERETITRILCVEIGGEEPSLYMLAAMVRSVSHSCEFLSVATVIKTLSQARRAGRRCKQALSSPLERDIKHAEKRLPLIAKKEAEDEAKRLEQLREQVKEFPPGCSRAVTARRT